MAPSPDVTKAWACTASARVYDLSIGARAQQGREVGDPASFMVCPPSTALVGPANCSPKFVSHFTITRYLHGVLSWAIPALQKGISLDPACGTNSITVLP